MDDALYPPQQGLPRGLLRLRENVCLALLRRLAVQPIHRAVDGVVLPVGELDGPMGSPVSAYGIKCRTHGWSERNEREVSTADRDLHYTPLPPPDAPVEVDEPGTAHRCAGLLADLAYA